MTAAKAKPAAPARPTPEQFALYDGQTVAYPIELHRWRILFEGGLVLDVLSGRDSDRMRGWARELVGAERIEGITMVEQLAPYTPPIPTREEAS